MFEDEPRGFMILPHGDSKSESSIFFKRTLESTIESIKNRLILEDPRKALDHVAEEVGGILMCQSSGSLPRNAAQSYYSKSKIPVAINLKKWSVISSSDPHASLTLKCKEQAKNVELAFVRKVECAPEPVTYLMNKKQLKDIEKFSTNEVKFGVFQINSTFNLGEFSVTTTQYQHLLLVNRISGQPPDMAKPVMIHQKKERITYRAFANFIASLKPKLRSIREFGTEYEANLYNAFKDGYPNVHHLLLSTHFKNNIKDHLHKIGVDEANKRLILSDLFGEQTGTRFEEGIVDAENEVDFEERLTSLHEI